MRHQTSDIEDRKRRDCIRICAPFPRSYVPIRIGCRTSCQRSYALGSDNCHPVATQSATRIAIVAKWRKTSHLFQFKEAVERACRHEAARLTGEAATISAMSFTLVPNRAAVRQLRSLRR